MYRLKQLTLLLGDLIMLYVGLYLAVALRYFKWPERELTTLISPMSILFFLTVIIIFIIGLYDLGQLKNTKIFFKKILAVSLAWLCIGVLFFYINPYDSVSPKTILLLTTISGFSLISLWRYLYNKFVSTSIWQLNVYFVGITDEVKELIKKILKRL